MARKKQINNKNIPGLTDQETTGNKDQSLPAARKRGRPKGSKNSIKTVRKDNIQSPAVVNDETRQRINNFNIALFQLPKVDRNDEQQITDRVNLYFTLCNQFVVSPTVAGFAMALGIDRRTLWTWIENKNDVIKNKNVIDILKRVYNSINSQYELMLTEGKIIPVSAFFLMQNNYGYKQQTDHVITTNQDNNDTVNDITDRAGLLD